MYYQWKKVLEGDELGRFVLIGCENRASSDRTELSGSRDTGHNFIDVCISEVLGLAYRQLGETLISQFINTISYKRLEKHSESADLRQGRQQVL